MNQAFIKTLYSKLYDDSEQEICGNNPEYRVLSQMWINKIREYNPPEELVEIFNQRLLLAMQLSYIKGMEDHNNM